MQYVASSCNFLSDTMYHSQRLGIHQIRHIRYTQTYYVRVRLTPKKGTSGSQSVFTYMIKTKTIHSFLLAAHPYLREVLRVTYF